MPVSCKLQKQQAMELKHDGAEVYSTGVKAKAGAAFFLRGSDSSLNAVRWLRDFFLIRSDLENARGKVIQIMSWRKVRRK
jgi:hypothetical protein